MKDFWSQFLSYAWPLILFIVGMIFLYIGLWIWMRRRRKIGQQQKKAAIQSQLEGNTPKAKAPQKLQKKAAERVEAAAKSEQSPSILDEYNDPLEANRLGDLLAESADEEFETFGSKTVAEDDFESFMAGDDPLAELYQARDVAEKERELQAKIEDDDEIVELASLLAGLGDEEEEIVYHTVSETPIAVKLQDGKSTYAREHISILRDERDERLIVQLENNAFRTLLDDKDAKKTFTKIMKELTSVILNADDNTDLEKTAADAGEYHEISAEPVHVKLFGGAETTALELMSIMRDERDSRLMVQLGDTAYRSLANEKQNKSNFTKTMKELAAVILTVDENPPQIATLEKAKAEPLSYQPVSDKVTRIVEDAQWDKPAEDIPGLIHIPKMDDLPPTHTVGRFGRIEVKKPAEEVPELNIAEAIEKYLQYKIEQTAQFQQRGIHIRPALGGGVHITVDGKAYDFVDEVDDEQARTFIQQTIDEWQNQH